MRRIFSCVGVSVIAAIALNLRAYAQPLPATASVQIVNATSVPVITLRVNDNLAYDAFPQGKRSADAPVRLLEAVYEAEDKRSGSRAKSGKIAYEAGTYQSLVILGDFSTPARILRQPGRVLSAEENESQPNVLFQVYSHAATRAPVRLRIINGMPGKSLTFVAGTREIAIKPGDHAVVQSQPATAQYEAKVDGESIPLLMRQEGLIRNAMVIFYLKDGKPAFMRAFENNEDSNRMRAELEKAR
jgi:hypothetical protein